MLYKNLEQKYYNILQRIAFSFTRKKAINKKKLPYVLEASTLHRLCPSRYWIISSISGGGKTTIAKFLVSNGFKKLPNITTRPKRPEEKKDEYVFVDKTKFLNWKNKDLIFYPHERNGVLHGILKKDIKKIGKKKYLMYSDKSVASSIFLKNKLALKNNFTCIYILAPTFRDLYDRIKKRESNRKTNNFSNLSKIDIFKRFKEEIDDMKRSTELEYIYIVNDSLDRVKNVLKKTIKQSVLL